MITATPPCPRPADDLTDRQRRVLEIIREHIDRHGESPTHQHIAGQIGVARHIVLRHLQALENRGLIVQHVQDGISLIDPPQPAAPDDASAVRVWIIREPGQPQRIMLSSVLALWCMRQCVPGTVLLEADGELTVCNPREIDRQRTA